MSRLGIRYRARRDALAETLPEAELLGIAAGLHATVRLPAGVDEASLRAEASRRGIAPETMRDYDDDSAPVTGCSATRRCPSRRSGPG